jgi:glycogen debranching enzyme
MIHGDDDSNRDTSDAPLWFIVACAELADRCGGMDVLRTRAGNRTLADVARSIARHYLQGTPNGIRVDPESGLVFSPSHFTWMDTNHPASTPREGYPIEIQALWFASLAFLERLDGDAPLPDWRQKLAHSILRYYRLDGHEGLSDCLHAGPGVPASAADADDHVRPNQLLALTLGAVQSPDAARDVLRVCQRLLVPGAIRSLADQRVSRRLPVQAPDGTLLNDPEHPYWGTYRGREDTRRKPAYHNGTAWTWLFPSYAEALVRVYGAAAQPTALSLLTASQERFSAGCIGHFCEIVEGDAPHEPRGCGAQAWSMAEYQRVLAFLRAMR